MPYIDFKDTLPAGFSDGECRLFNVRGFSTPNYMRADNKILFVIQHVDSSDLKLGKLLASSPCKETFDGILDLAKSHACKHSKRSSLSFEWAAVNFNYFRNYHLKGVEYQRSLELSAKRIRRIVKSMKPSMVVILGDLAAECLIDVPHVKFMRGCIHDVDYNGYECPTVNSLDFDRTYVVKLDEDEDDLVSESATDDQYETAVANANSVDIIAHHISNAILGRMAYSGKIKPKAVLVDTIEKFDKLYKALWNAECFGYDIESTGLDNYNNKIVTHQFSFDETKGYVLPYYHYQTPFDSYELKYIKSKLKKLFAKKVSKVHHIVGQNLRFDLRLIRQEFGLNYIDWNVYDVTAGEFLLCENYKILEGYGTKPYELSHILARYGDDYYYTAEFSKGERTLIANSPLEDSLEYCAADVQSVMLIKRLQMARAANIEHIGGTYEKAFMGMMLGVQSCLTRVMSIMIHRGLQLDLNEFYRLLSENGPVRTRLVEVKKELNASENVKKTNSILLKEMAIPEKGMFGKVNTWVFDVQKVAHKKMLFFDVMGLEPVRMGKDGPSMDKFFQKKYSDVPEVAKLAEIQRLNIINNTYIVGWYRKLSEDPDSALDARMRPSYGYTAVVTGRSNSTRPNLQNVPQHSAEAKYIKRLIVSGLGFLSLDADYSAHEVRGWGLISKDPSVAEAFQKCLDLIYEFRRNPTPANLKRMLLEADIHKVNYSLYTGTPIDKVTKEQRQSSKAIVFGNIYGMGLRSLAAQIKKAVEEAEAISKKFFGKFVKAKGWLDWAVSHTGRKGYVYSPLGRRRNLQGYAVPVKALRSAMERRGMNSPIQGMGSDFGFIGSNEYTRAIDQFITDNGIQSNAEWFKDKGYYDSPLTSKAFLDNPAFAPIGVNSMVHDSIKTQVRYDLIYIALHLKEWAMIRGVREYVKDRYGFNFNVDLAIEFEVGCSSDTMTKWLFVVN
jgi:DNA polymerase I-like protein with 3'-5' exonuclease and polymerase domains